MTAPTRIGTRCRGRIAFEACFRMAVVNDTLDPPTAKSQERALISCYTVLDRWTCLRVFAVKSIGGLDRNSMLSARNLT